MSSLNITSSPSPKIAVLLAAYNGMQWIEEQLDTIVGQENVELTIFISVDLSTDGTYQWCQQQALKDDRINVLPYGERFGGAAKNFYRLFRDVDFSRFDYVSLSDQDDIWLSDKLIFAHKQIVKFSADSYSSNVLAFWPNGNEKLINKSQPQKKYDCFFEAGGPGCTYVFKATCATDFQKFLTSNWEHANEVALHDWLIYAFCRANSYRWFIDQNYKMLYRQHENNEVGVNEGMKAFLRRISQVKNGWYQSEVKKIVSLISQHSPNNISPHLFNSKLFLLKNCFNLRRRFRDVIVLFFFVLVGFF